MKKVTDFIKDKIRMLIVITIVIPILSILTISGAILRFWDFKSVMDTAPGDIRKLIRGY